MPKFQGGHRFAAKGGARCFVPLLLACAAFAACSDARAQARGPSLGELKAEGRIDPPPTREQMLIELDAWLRRLPGRYRRVGPDDKIVDDVVIDCAAIGEGAGVNCVEGAKGSNRHAAPPKMSLYGIDPELPGIRYLRVNDVSMAESNLGPLSGDTARFFGTCPTPPTSGPAVMAPIRCAVEMRIELPVSGQDMVMFQLRTITYVAHFGGHTRVTSVPMSSRVQWRRVPEWQS